MFDNVIANRTLFLARWRWRGDGEDNTERRETIHNGKNF